MKFVIPGGTGQIGTILTRHFLREGHEVTVLARRSAALSTVCRFAQWDGRTLGPWAREIEGSDVVINLAGRTVNCRYSESNRRQIMDSRVDSTRIVGQAIQRSTRPPRLWVQASTATIYAHTFDAPNDEATGRIGGNEPDKPDSWKFSTDVAQAWEQAANEIPTPDTRKVLMRSAMVMSPDTGGIFDTLLRLVRLGLGGTSGNGQQYVSWIHDQDFIRAISWLINRADVAGPVNIASPHPLPNKQFMRILRAAWGQPVGLPAFDWMLEIGAFLMRTETELVLKSRKVVPGVLLQNGFDFAYPTWELAAENLCQRRREMAAQPRAAADI